MNIDKVADVICLRLRVKNLSFLKVRKVLADTILEMSSF